MVCQENEEEAKTIFHESGIIVTTEGTRHLGAALGLPSFIEGYVFNKVDGWKDEIEKLATIAGSQPHACCLCCVCAWHKIQMEVFVQKGSKMWKFVATN